MYPSNEEIDEANLVELCRWRRFLPSPGMSAAGTDQFQSVLCDETAKMDKIRERIKCLGGMTPEISKRIGWTQ